MSGADIWQSIVDGRAQWQLDDAMRLSRLVEGVCPEFGCHVALTGGLLYKDGPRKDCDLLFYRIRQTPEIDILGLWGALEGVGLLLVKDFGWCVKFRWGNLPVDCFFPERPKHSLPPRINPDLHQSSLK
jgi:hypothetical protein